MRATAGNAFSLPSRTARTVTRFPGEIPEAIPSTEKISIPVNPSVSRVTPSANCSGRVPPPPPPPPPGARPPGPPGAGGAPGSVLLSRDDQERDSLPLVTHRGVVDRHRFAVRQVDRPPPLGARREKVGQAGG